MIIEVTLDDFDQDDIVEYIKNRVDLPTTPLDLYDEDELIEEVERRGYIVVNKHFYPHNDIISQDLIERFNDGFGKINKKELEEFLTRFGV